MTSETRFTRRCFRASKRGQRAQTRDCLLPQPGTTRVTLCRSSRVFLGVPLTLSLSVRCKALPSLSLRSLQLRCRLLLLVTLVTGFLSTPFEQTPRGGLLVGFVWTWFEEIGGGELLSRTGSLSRPGPPGLRSSTAPPIPRRGVRVSREFSRPATKRVYTGRPLMREPSPSMRERRPGRRWKR